MGIAEVSRVSTIAGMISISLLSCISARAGERLSDNATGFSLRLPDGFAFQNRQNGANHDVLVDIVSRSGEPPVAGTSGAVCAAGFKRSPPGFDQSQEDLNRTSAMEYMANESRRRLGNLGLEVQSVEKIDRSDLAGLEFTMIPGNGPDHRNVRIYMAIMDRPAGRADVICATTRTALPSALASSARSATRSLFPVRQIVADRGVHASPTVSSIAPSSPSFAVLPAQTTNWNA